MRRTKFNILEFSTTWSRNKDLWLLKNLEKCKKSHRVRSKPLSKEFWVEQSETKQLLLFPVSFQSGNIFIRNQITLLTRHNIKQWTVLIHNRGRTANSPGITGNWKLKTKKTQVARSLCLLGRGGVGAGLRLSGLNPSPAYHRTKQSPNNALPGNIIFQLQRSQFHPQTESVAAKAHWVVFCMYTFRRTELLSYTVHIWFLLWEWFWIYW